MDPNIVISRKLDLLLMLHGVSPLEIATLETATDAELQPLLDALKPSPVVTPATHAATPPLNQSAAEIAKQLTRIADSQVGAQIVGLGVTHSPNP